MCRRGDQNAAADSKIFRRHVQWFYRRRGNAADATSYRRFGPHHHTAPVVLNFLSDTVLFTLSVAAHTELTQTDRLVPCLIPLRDGPIMSRFVDLTVMTGSVTAA